MPYKSKIDRNKAQRRYEKTLKGKISLRKGHLKYSYNMTLEEYNKLFKSQYGVCAICGHPELNRSLLVDHNHKTGKIRGLLCTLCNVLIGQIERTPEFYSKAKEYLNK